uniref:Uncharacterized protein n=1 Tax=Oryza barthii TaxID=65489 RepID=A0A0D3FUP8_9ORYZ
MGIGGGGEQIGAEGGGGDLATKGIPAAGSVAVRSSSAWKVSAAGIGGGEEQLGVEGVGSYLEMKRLLVVGAVAPIWARRVVEDGQKMRHGEAARAKILKSSQLSYCCLHT